VKHLPARHGKPRHDGAGEKPAAEERRFGPGGGQEGGKGGWRASRTPGCGPGRPFVPAGPAPTGRHGKGGSEKGPALGAAGGTPPIPHRTGPAAAAAPRSRRPRPPAGPTGDGEQLPYFYCGPVNMPTKQVRLSSIQEGSGQFIIFISTKKARIGFFLDKSENPLPGR
jgi:hypothetical protein